MTRPNNDSPIAIFARLFDPDRIDLPPESAQALLKVTFDQDDRNRMHELAQQAQRGELSGEEERELDNYLLVGDLLTVMHARLRTAMKKLEVAP